MERTTVTLILSKQATAAVAKMKRRTGRSTAEVTRIAWGIYSYLLDESEQGSWFQIIKKDGTVKEVHFKLGI